MFQKKFLAFLFVFVTLCVSFSSLGLSLHVSFHDHHHSESTELDHHEHIERVGLFLFVEHAHEEDADHEHEETNEEIVTLKYDLKFVSSELRLYAIKNNFSSNQKLSFFSKFTSKDLDKYNAFSPHRFRSLPLLN